MPERLPERRIWRLMIARCEKRDHPLYPHYGGRGIAVCERWRSFENFLADMGPRPSSEHSIDRIDNEGNYEPGNCRWATRRQQMNNRRNNVFLELRGERRTLSEWARLAGMRPVTLWRRLNRGWSAEDALTISTCTENFSGI